MNEKYKFSRTRLPCKAQRQYLLTCKVSRYCLLALHGRRVNMTKSADISSAETTHASFYYTISSHYVLFMQVFESEISWIILPTWNINSCVHGFILHIYETIPFFTIQFSSFVELLCDIFTTRYNFALHSIYKDASEIIFLWFCDACEQQCCHK